jgi:hypothetical protein
LVVEIDVTPLELDAFLLKNEKGFMTDGTCGITQKLGGN